jgi:hypothetical protein
MRISDDVRANSLLFVSVGQSEDGFGSGSAKTRGPDRTPSESAPPPGQYSVSAKRTGYFPYMGPLLTVDPAQPASLSIRLTPFSRIEGKVTGEDGEPLSGSVTFPGWGTAVQGGTPAVAADGTFVASIGAGHFFAGVYGPKTAQTPDGDLQGTWPRC